MKMIIESVSQGNSLAAIILITTTIITQVQSRTRFMGLSRRRTFGIFKKVLPTWVLTLLN